jgi:Tfp pilus assembly protein PilF
MGEVLDLDGGEAAQGEATFETDSAAVAIALERARTRRRKTPAGETEADRFLAAQEGLIADQRRHLHEQLRHLGLKLWSERLKLGLQALTILVGVFAVGVAASMAWAAHEADGLVIKPFSMPPALAQRGVTGEAVANKIMDRLSTMAEIARPSERQKTVDADWGEHISIEIPETGVSLSQVDQWLREKLGGQRRITGEVSLNPDGTLTVDARIGGHPLPPQTGPQADLDRMETKVAEAIYGREQPLSMYQYLGNQGRWREALDRAWAEARAAKTPEARALSLNGVGFAVQNLQGDLAAKPYYERALAMTPQINAFVPRNLSNVEADLGHIERGHALVRLALARERVSKTETPEAQRTSELNDQAAIAADLGDFGETLRDVTAMSQTNLSGFVGENGPDLLIAWIRANLHETGAATAMLQAFEPQGKQLAFLRASYLAQAHVAAGDWAGAASQVDQASALAAMAPDHGAAAALRLKSLKARTLARLGRLAEAQRLVEPLPPDCAYCLLARAEVAQAAGEDRAADRWYGEAVGLTPSLPAANEAWGRALLARGDARGALVRFDAAHAKGPRFADPIEGRGEARLALGDAQAAAAAFAEAARLTPRWGRLRLKWGEALARQGKAAEAKAQFRTAAGMDLTAAERAELSAQGV